MSFQTRSLKEEYVPLHRIRRPIPPVLDNQKIDAMILTLNGIPTASATCKLEDITSGELPPIDVFRVREHGKDYFFAFGGCHRFQAYEKLAGNNGEVVKKDGAPDGETLVKCRLLPATRDSLKVYLGGSVDSMFD